MNMTEFARYIDRRHKEADGWYHSQRREWAQQSCWFLDEDEVKDFVYKYSPPKDDNAVCYTYNSASGDWQRTVKPVQKLVSVEDLL